MLLGIALDKKEYIVAVCENHEMQAKQIERMRDEIAELYGRTATMETAIAELRERDKHREDIMERIESTMEKNQARTEALIEGLGKKVEGKMELHDKALEELRNAGDKKLAASTREYITTLVKYLITAGAGGGIIYAFIKLFGG